MSGLRSSAEWVISDSGDESDTETKPKIKRPDPGAENARVPPTRSDLVPEHTPCAPPRHTAVAQSPKRRRRTKKEAPREDTLKTQEKREAREKQRVIRAKEKEEKRQEQQRRREAAEHMKSLRPENCLKCLSVRIDPAVLQFDGSDILLGTLEASEWKFSIETQGLPQSISWTRELLLQEGDRGSVEEDQVLLVLDLADFIDIVIGVRKTLENSGDAPADQSHLGFLLTFLSRHADKMVTVLVMGSPPTNGSKAWDAPALQSQMGLGSLDIEEVLVYLQLYRNISLSFIRGWQELTNHVSAVTKALSKRPFKKLAEQVELPFCVDASWASGVRVERDGSGLGQVWTRQLQQLNRVSAAMATAVTRAHRSPRLLLQAYQSAETEEARKGVLAGLQVGGEEKERRIGPEMSSRVYRCLTAQNPELVLD